jgi:membrane protein YdbS with pleckstrin-like domain
MTQPTTYGGRPPMAVSGAPTPELRVARFRRHARKLTWSALVLVAVAGAVGYFYGNLPTPFEDWMLLTAAAVVVLFLVLLPFLSWWSHVYTITTRRVIERSGILVARHRELVHVRGYTIVERRGMLQRMWGAGTLTLSNGVDEPLRLVNIPSVDLVHEALVDQVEVNQILAHRDAQPLPPPPPPGRPN